MPVSAAGESAVSPARLPIADSPNSPAGQHRLPDAVLHRDIDEGCPVPVS
jgi:hypothetical protein